MLQQAQGPEGDVAKIYYPADGTWASLTHEVFAFPDRFDRFASVFWSRPTDLVIAQMQLIVHAVPARVSALSPCYLADVKTRIEVVME